MKLSDLKTGMRIVLRNGQELIVLKDVITPNGKKEDMYVKKDGGFMAASDYNDDMTRKSADKEWDITKVYEQNNGKYLDAVVLSSDIEYFDLIWERTKAKKMTVSEICKELGYEVEIIKED